MAALEAEVAASPRDAAPPPPHIWLSELVERFASFLHPNDVICTLRRVDKATAEQFRGRPEFASVRLSQPAPPHAFSARWAAPGATRDLTLARRKQLLSLTAASGVVANLDVAIEAVGYTPDEYELRILPRAAAAAGHVDAVIRLLDLACSQGIWYVVEAVASSALAAAAQAGRTAVCETLISCVGAQGILKPGHVAAALSGGQPETAEWLLQQLPEGAIGPGDSLAPLGPAVCSQLLRAAAEGCDLAALSSLRRRCNDVPLPPGAAGTFVSSAAASPTADWQAKVEWAESQLPPDGFPQQKSLVWPVACPDADLRLAWLLDRGYLADGATVNAALTSGVSLAALQLLLARGLRPDPRAVEEAAHGGRLEALKTLREHGCPLDARAVMRRAAVGGQLPVLVWAVEELGASVQDQWMGPTTSRFCDLEALQWLQQRGCRLDVAEVCLGAARRGDLPALAWAMEELRATPARVTCLMDAAAAAGSVELMAWLRERGCFMYRCTFQRAAGSGCVAALEWLAEQGCAMPRDGGPYDVADNYGDLAILRCLTALGCPRR
ncbi:hypothetical protein GPECTOR_13g655 [Gonium pectorale]|uniref:Ankyrin repeat domain-containing protein n=1 Tax=Gonium pectorale TaxID=33097 RepID=A0A150GN18_GONPE|nr:hypothetical protein GPECTOR_13g655 [Gonium pectorale]|eukprot:KXZ51168.1 hypothetical protein GPECTOR_13g655 [Gonium pectorale]